MISELDLPCSACGGELQKVEIQFENETTVIVAECRICDERHYPEQALTHLGER